MSNRKSGRHRPISPVQQGQAGQPFFASKHPAAAAPQEQEHFFPAQTKRDSQPGNDPLEKEADEVAEQVVAKKSGGFLNPDPFFKPVQKQVNSPVNTPQLKPQEGIQGKEESDQSVSLADTITQNSVTTQSSAVVQKKDDPEKEYYRFRTKYVPAMDGMSEKELAAYCFSKVTGRSQASLLSEIEQGSIRLNGKWSDAKSNLTDGYYHFSLEKSLYYRLTGYMEEGTDTEGAEQGDEEVPDSMLGNGSETGDGSGTGGGSGNGDGTGLGPSFYEKRGEDQRRVGAEERDEYYANLPQEERQAVVREANARFYELYELDEGYQLQEGDPDFAKELWKEKRDEVLIEKIQMDRLPSGLRSMIADGKETAKPEDAGQYKKLLHYLSGLNEMELEALDLLLHSGDKAVPMDVEQLIRISKMMSNFTPSDYMDYMSQISADANSMEDFADSLQRFIQRKQEKAEEMEQMEGIKTKLFGLEALYKAYKAYKSDVSANKTMKSIPGDKFERQMDRKALQESSVSDSALATKREELTAEMQANGFESIEQFEKFIADYEASFRQYAVRLAEDHLLRYRHNLFEEKKKLQNDAHVQHLYQQLKGSGAAGHYEQADQHRKNASAFSYQEDRYIPHHMKMKSEEQQKAGSERAAGRASVETLDTPLVKEDQFEHEDFASAESPEEMKQFLLDYISEKNDSVSEAWSDLHENTEYIYDLDVLFSASMQNQGITEDDIFGMIIKEKKEEIANKNLVQTIGIVFLAVVLTIVSLGTAGPLAAIAGGAALGLSLGSVYEAIEEYKKADDANNVGLLSDDPSLVWVVLAIAGAVFDAAALAAVLKSAGPIAKATKAFNETGDLLTLEKQLGEVAELSERVKVNILKSAKAEAEAKQMISSVLKPQAGMLKMSILPGGEEFARLVAAAYYMAKKGVIDFQSYLLKLKAEKIIDDITTLSTKEKKILKDAFEKGKLMRGADDLTAQQIDEAIEQGDFVRLSALVEETNLKLLGKEYALEFSQRVKETGRFRKASNYHADSSHSFSDGMVKQILENPSEVFISKNEKYMIFYKDGDMAVVIYEGSGRGNVVTAYGRSGVKGQSGARALGGLPEDPGVAITPEMILKGEIPASDGFFPPATRVYP